LVETTEIEPFPGMELTDEMRAEHFPAVDARMAMLGALAAAVTLDPC
jgi:hypothetical protein